jgi:branched-chain amino acid transport system permease protein
MVNRPGIDYPKFAAGLVVFGLFACVPFFVTEDYILYILSLCAVMAIIASGLNITNGYAGLLNLAVGGIVATGAYVTVIMLLEGMPMLLAVLSAAVGGGIVAAVIFLVFARLRGFFFGLATIAAAEVIRLLIRNLDDITNGVRGLKGYPRLTETPATTYWVLLAALAVVIILTVMMASSSLGLRWRAIRENRDKASSMGIPVRRLQFSAYVISGMIMAFGGGLYGVLLQYIEPNLAGLGTLVQTILMVALGGAGTVLGPVIGAAAITLIPEVLRMANDLRLVIYGLTLIVVVLTLPGGIMGTILRNLRARRRATPRPLEIAQNRYGNVR